jgi:hypothetical protein
MAVVYDELYISTMREISVCRKKIGKLKKDLGKMERNYGMTTEEFIRRFGEGGMRDHDDFSVWHDCYVGLKNWEERLRGYHEILESH